MSSRKQVRVAVNGYGVIGKRVAETIRLQDDMILAGISDGGRTASHSYRLR
jgi:glyceraldehyde-3-phosphate dehydrogenase (NAD(P))